MEDNSAERVEKICELLSQEYRNPASELTYCSDYTFLVAVVLSAQATDVQVNKVTAQLFKDYKTAADIIDLGEEGLREKISSIGLYKNKAKNIFAFSRILDEKYDGAVPKSREELESLPGVGRKSANVVLNTLCGCPVIAVDTHVLRLSKRLGFSESGNPLKIENDLERIIPEKYKNNISNFIVLHGRYVCKAKKPMCEKCTIRELCHSGDKITHSAT